MSALLPHGRSPPRSPTTPGRPPPPAGPLRAAWLGLPSHTFPVQQTAAAEGEGARRAPAAEPGRRAGRGRAGAGEGRRGVGAARGSGRGRGGTSYSSSEAMVGGGVAGGREGQGRGEAPPPPGGRHFVSVGSLRGLRFLLPLPAPGAQHGRASHTHCQCGPAAAAAGLCAGAAAQRALRAPRSLPGGPARARAHRAPPRGRAGLGRARRRCTAARLAPWLPLSGVVQKASYLRPKNLPRLLSMPSAAARARRSRAPALRVFGPPAREGRGGRRGGAAEGSSGLRSGPRRAGCRREQAGRKGRSQRAVGGAEARRGRGRGERWAGPRLLQVPSRGVGPGCGAVRLPASTWVPGPGLGGTEGLEGRGDGGGAHWGRHWRARSWAGGRGSELPASGAHCPDGRGRVAKCSASHRAQSSLLRAPNADARPGPGRPAKGGRRGQVEPPALTRARLPLGSRQDPEPEPEAPPCGPERSGHASWAAGRGWEPGAGARRSRGRREGAAASTLPAASPTPGLPVPLGASTSSEGELGGGARIWALRGLGSNGTKLSMGGTAWTTKTTGPRGQNSYGLTLPTLLRRDGQSGDGPPG